MDASAADGQVDRLTELWYDHRSERNQPTDDYQRLRVSLRRFLPPDALAGLAFGDSDEDPPFVVALTDEALLLFRAPDQESTLDVVVAPLRTICSLKARGTESSTPRFSYRECRWEIRRSEDEDFNVRTLAPAGPGWGTENGGELVMLTLAEKLGWSTPLKEQVTS